MTKLWYIPVILPSLVAIIALLAFPTVSQGGLTIKFYDIGQGDGIFIQTHENKRIVVDGGPDMNRMADLLQRDMGYFNSTLDLVVVSHPDSDHINGLMEVLRRFEVKVLLINYLDENPLLVDLLQVAQERGIEVKIAKPDQDIIVDSTTAIDVIAPSEEISDDAQNDNDRSIVFRLVAGKHSFLFTGDAEVGEESAILKEGHNIKTTYLKGGHHGSTTSSSENFLKAVDAQFVIFQNGKDNSYGHPAEEVMTRVASLGSLVYNTSLSGTVEVHCQYDQDCIIKEEYAQDPSVVP